MIKDLGLTDEQIRVLNLTSRSKATHILIYLEVKKFRDGTVNRQDIVHNVANQISVIYDEWHEAVFDSAINNLETFGILPRIGWGQYQLTDNADKLMEDRYGKYHIDVINEVSNLISNPNTGEEQMDVQSVVKAIAEIVEKEQEHKKELAAKDQRIENQIANINQLTLKLEDSEHDNKDLLEEVESLTRKNEELNNNNDDLTILVEALTNKVEELESDNAELAQALRVIRNYDAKYAKE